MPSWMWLWRSSGFIFLPQKSIPLTTNVSSNCVHWTYILSYERLKHENISETWQHFFCALNWQKWNTKPYTVDICHLRDYMIVSIIYRMIDMQIIFLHGIKLQCHKDSGLHAQHKSPIPLRAKNPAARSADKGGRSLSLRSRPDGEPRGTSEWANTGRRPGQRRGARGVTAVSHGSCIFPYVEKSWIPSLERSERLLLSVRSLSRVWLSVTPRTAARQAPLTCTSSRCRL